MNAIKKLVVLPFVMSLISCSDSDSIPTLVQRNVVSTSGIDFNTGKIVSINPLNGQEILPCGNTNDIFIDQNNSERKKVKQGSKDETHDEFMQKPCNTQIARLQDPSLEAALKETIKISEKPINGVVLDNGVEKEARFVIEVTALYEGSHCVTTFSAGQKRRKCIKTEQCAALAAQGFAC